MYPCGSGFFRAICMFWWELFYWFDYFLSCVFWDFVVEVGFGAVGACLFDASVGVS
jgi:hypothetical protein